MFHNRATYNGKRREIETMGENRMRNQLAKQYMDTGDRIAGETVEDRIRAQVLQYIEANLSASEPINFKPETDPDEPHMVCNGVLIDEKTSLHEEIEQIGKNMSKVINKTMNQGEDMEDIAKCFEQMEIDASKLLKRIDNETKKKYRNAAAKYEEQYTLHYNLRKNAFKALEKNSLSESDRRRLLATRICPYPKDVKELSEAQLEEIFEFFPVYKYIANAEMDNIEAFLAEDCDYFNCCYEEDTRCDFRIESCSCLEVTFLSNPSISNVWHPIIFAVVNNYHLFLKKFAELASRNFHVQHLIELYLGIANKSFIEQILLSEPPDNKSLRILLSNKYIYSNYIPYYQEFVNIYTSREEQFILPMYEASIFPGDYLASTACYTEKFLPVCIAHGHKQLFLDIFSGLKSNLVESPIIRQDIPRILVEIIHTNDLEFINNFVTDLLIPFLEFYYGNKTIDLKNLLFHSSWAEKMSQADSFVHVAVRSLNLDLLRAALNIIKNIYKRLKKVDPNVKQLKFDEVINVDLLTPIELAVELNNEEMLNMFKQYGYEVKDNTKLRMYSSIVNNDRSAGEFVTEICSKPDLPAKMSLLSLLITTYNDELAFKVLQLYDKQGFTEKQIDDLNHALLCALYPDRLSIEVARIKNKKTAKIQQIMDRVGMLLMAGAKLEGLFSINNISERVPEVVIKFVKDVHTNRQNKKYQIVICPPKQCFDRMFTFFDLIGDDYDIWSSF